MSTYVTLCNWTNEGLHDFKDSVHRSEEFTKLVENSGGRVREILWTIGEYDSLAIVDFPDDETAVATLLQVGSEGKIRTRTLRAFDPDAMSSILRKAG